MVVDIKDYFYDFLIQFMINLFNIISNLKIVIYYWQSSKDILIIIIFLDHGRHFGKIINKIILLYFIIYDYSCDIELNIIRYTYSYYTIVNMMCI